MQNNTSALNRYDVAAVELVAMVAAIASESRRPIEATGPCECCAEGAHEGNDVWVELLHTAMACDCTCNTSAAREVTQ